MTGSRITDAVALLGRPAGFLLCLMGSAAQAQTAAPANASVTTDEDIVVVANKLGAVTERLPISVTTISAAQIAQDRLQTIQDVQGRTPSLVFDTSSVFAQPYIRGMGSNFSLAGLETAVATYVDGVYQQRQAGAVLDLVDLSSVQVLKGPQGTLYGRNATGGVILLQTADPTDKFEGSVMGEYGRFDQARVQAVFNVPITDTLAIRVAGQHQRNDGYIRDLNTGGKRGDGKKTYLRAKVQWSPTDAFTLTYGIEYSRSRSTAYSERQILPAPFCLACSIYGVEPSENFYESTNSDDQFFKVRYVAQTLRLSYEADDFTVDSITGYRDQNVHYINDQDFTGPDFFSSNVREKGPTLTNDTYLRTRFSSPLNVLVGFSFERERDKQTALLVGDAFGGLVPRNFNNVHIDSFSIYGEGTYEIMPGLKFTAGARFNQDRKRITVENNDDAVLALGGVAEGVARRRFRNVTPRALLSYEDADGFYYASYNRGARSGGFGSPIIALTPAVKPETLDNFEIGAKNRFLDGRLRTTAALFYGVYKDIQIQIVDSTTGSVVLQNAARGKVSGAEFDARLAVTPAFNLSGGVTYLDNKFKRYRDGAIFLPVYDDDGAPVGIISGSADLSGTRLPRSPRWSGYAAADYTFTFSNDWSLRAATVARMTSSYLFSAGAGGPLGIDRQKGYTIVDATLDFISPDEKTDIGLFVKNAFGTHFVTQALTGTFGAFVAPPMPSSYGIRFSQKF